MKRLKRYGFFFVALPLLVLLFVRSQVDLDAWTRADDATHRMRELDTQLDMAVLDASAGLVLNYDTFTHTLREMHRLEAELAASPFAQAPAVARVSAHVREKERLVEDFQTSNAIRDHSKVGVTTHQLRTMDRGAYEELYRVLRDGREAAITRANRYRLGLIAISAALLVMVVGLFSRREEYKALLEEGSLLEAELRAAQKLESLGRLSAGVAHEINTPVQFVSDSVHYIKEAFTSLAGLIGVYRRTTTAAEARVADELADTDYALENVPAALDSALEGLERIATIVKSLKDFSHPDRSEKSAVDLNANIRSTVTIATNEYKHVADVVLDLGELGPVTCHGGEINQVLLNLIVNSAHAIGDVVAKTKQRGKIEIQTRQEFDAVYVSVKDTGGGIPDAIQDKVFDPFFTTKEVGKGTGQGLALARRIVVDKHEGELTFQSKRGEGTTFVLKLPCDRPSLLRMVA